MHATSAFWERRHRQFPDGPARGKARGGCSGPHCTAGLGAQNALGADSEIEVDTLFLPDDQGK